MAVKKVSHVYQAVAPDVGDAAQENVKLRSEIMELKSKIRTLEERAFAGELDRTRWDFLTNMSQLIVHDLGTPLQLMSYYTSCLASGEELPKDFAEVVNESALRARDLIDSLKAYLKSPGSQTRDGVTNVGEAIRDAVRIVRIATAIDYAQDSDVKVEIRVDMSAADMTEAVAMARGDFLHVFTNLLSNAVAAAGKLNEADAAEKASVVGVAVKRPSGDNGGLIFLISNPGSALSQKDFDWLTRGAFGLSSEADGYEPEPGKFKSGSLGLRLVRQLVEGRGGEICIDPSTEHERGDGTVVRVALPLSKRNA